MNISSLINELTEYGLKTGLIDPADKIYTINRLLELFGVNEYAPGESGDLANGGNTREINAILSDMLDYAAGEGLIEDTIGNRDLFDTKIMGLLTPPPSTVINRFNEDYKRSPKEATDNYYRLACDVNYIRTDRIKKDEKWSTDTEFGKLDITINLSKPEKDPKDIARAAKAKTQGYPACLLCRENEGYAGHMGHPARQNHRIIPITLNDENYFLQYSPYVYYNEHCIIFNEKHVPMKIDRDAFVKLLDFTKKFPHYTAGSNADLPIVGGSILSHDHFQGGRYEFPMVRAEYEKEFELPAFPGVHMGRIKWPMSTLRLRGSDPDKIADAADHILKSWRAYTDKDAFIFAYTDEEGTDGTKTKVPHNTITPIARRRGDDYELDLVLRNNITTEDLPLGVYHPHPEYHHIKKENIGLIEVMGLAILPARLKTEMAALKEAMLNGDDLTANELTRAHAEWAEGFINKHKINKDNIDAVVRDEIALVFMHVLEDAGVYKRTAEGLSAFDRFIESL
ncbi:MAG: UDP-glucose--hexose-1-phosphate uridylyltransferase [Lachnospiraceae bacterium]|nr:UDP-glucose--hexose-1-phosphate uridylyltransferase [Lachnospiraceae bacterium]